MSKSKSKAKVTLTIIGISLVILVLGYFGVTNSIYGYNDYSEGELSYSGVSQYSGFGYPEGYIVTGIDNCGGRQNNKGVTMYWSCEVDESQSNLQPYSICIDDKAINRLGYLKLDITGYSECLNTDSNNFCYGLVNFYDDEFNNIGSLNLQFDGQTKDTANIVSSVGLNLGSGYKNILGEECFDFYVAGLNKPNANSGTPLAKMSANYRINSFQLYYDAVECSKNSECGNLEICDLTSYKCIDNPAVVENLPEDVKEEINETRQEEIEQEQQPQDTSNNQNVPDTSNIIVDTQTPIYIYLIPFGLVSLIIIILLMLIKKPKRKK